MKSAAVILVYPHQLFEDHPSLAAEPEARVYLVEDPLFFTQYQFHPRKIEYHRATMHRYRQELQRRGRSVKTVAAAELTNTEDALDHLGGAVRAVRVADPADAWLERALTRGTRSRGIQLTIDESPAFLLSRKHIDDYGADSDRLAQTDFYRSVRRRMGLLMDERGRPLGGRWSYDTDNRRKIPRSHPPPPASQNESAGSISFPASRREALDWLDEFLTRRLHRFGDYEDAIDARDDRWYHSVVSPMLNVGLLTPAEVIERTTAHVERVGIEFDLQRASARNAGTESGPVPINSLEGFIRQVIGWREFMRATYRLHGGAMRTRNFWNHRRPMPNSFYRGDTGLIPFDRVVEKTQRLAWAHHIERLMVAGNLMLLCEIDPDTVYRWFMELYIDAYDWVMVPNVYAMSQYADGGTITTKPYVGGSNYIRKMSDTPKGDWQETWDGLYWRFIDRRRDFFARNPRLSIMPRQLDRLDADRRRRIFARADDFLAGLE